MQQVNLRFHYLILLFFITISDHSWTQEQIKIIDGQLIEYDKCGFAINDSDAPQYISPEYMGYGYDSLLTDLELWRMSEYVKIDSIGLSVQGRPLWQLTISSDPNNVTGKGTVYIHARTHPQETEGFYVTNEMIQILLSESDFAQTIRSTCVFYIIPMYNPDGVVLGYPRKNANNVDLESNWNTFPHQPEVTALKNRFTELMASPNPIEVMLNMHSSSLCRRYFVYHHETGTSLTYALLEQDFINGARNYYSGGIEPYTYFVSWTSGTALQYPESWFWINHGENVMALTYEDMYQCTFTGNFDSTANAILHGVLDYMEIENGVPVELVSFTANYSNNLVNLIWTTATELNNHGFEIELSNDRLNWRIIGFKEGNGTSTELQNYYFVDDLSFQNKKSFYYRLKQIDFNGDFEYSDVVEIIITPTRFSLKQNFPNPFNPSTTISWESPLASWQTIKVYDLLGREIATLVDEYKIAGSYKIEFPSVGINGYSRLTSGVYLYRLQAGEFIQTKKMVLLK